MKVKAFRLASFKALDQAQGIFEAIVAVFGNVDRAGDKIIPGAFARSLANWQTKGRPIPVIFSHEWDNLDAHIGQVLEAKETDEGLYVKGQLEMDEPFAQRVWKKMSKGTLAEFSFAYDVVDAVVAKTGGEYVNELRELDLLEVGPCLVGMNPDTQLLGVKAKKACPVHSTATDDGAWDGPANERNVPSGKTAAFYRKVYAWQDPEGDATVKSSWRFIHHLVDADGNPGAASIRACQSAIGVLNGGRGGTTIPDADKQGVWDHLAKHLTDAGIEPPELKAASPEQIVITLTDDIDVAAFKAAWQALAVGFRKEGRRNSTADLARIQSIHDLTCELGAKCVAEADGEEASEGEAEKGKPSEAPSSTYAMRAAQELLSLGVA